jgi:rhodanese-related sulfurtransferase/rubrerythrin
MAQDKKQFAAVKKLFTAVTSMDPEEAKAYIAGHPEGTYTILDVRQPGEYEESHIPGARLIPLPRLPDAYQQLDPEKPIIVHCAVGGRSRVAAQLLTGLGFKQVFNLAGGIMAYRGQKAAGAFELNLDLVRGDETPGEIITLAYGMEKALQEFYEAVQARETDRELSDLAAQLAQVEVVHQQRLAALFPEVAPGQEPRVLEAGAATDILEGGFRLKEFLEKNAAHLETAPQLLELAMMLETQALDLYLRFGHRCSQASAREVLFTLAGEEKAHLARLGDLLETKLHP